MSANHTSLARQASRACFVPCACAITACAIQRAPSSHAVAPPLATACHCPSIPPCRAPASGTVPTPIGAPSANVPSGVAAPAETPAGVAAPPSTEAAPDISLASAESRSKTYLLQWRGARIKYVLPAPSGDPLIRKLEAYRKLTDGAKVVYVLAVVDNTLGGNQDVWSPTPLVVTTTRQTIEATDIQEAVAHWRVLPPSEDEYARMSMDDRNRRELERMEGIPWKETIGKYPESHAMPGSMATTVFTLAAPLPPVAAVYVRDVANAAELMAGKPPIRLQEAK